jgi:hypothetical protein
MHLFRFQKRCYNYIGLHGLTAAAPVPETLVGYWLNFFARCTGAYVALAIPDAHM